MLGSLFHFLQTGLGTSADLNIEEGSTRCSANGVIIHAPTQVNLRISGTYISVLPDAQVARVDWDSGLKQIDYADGAEAGFADTILSANTLAITTGNYVDWNLFDLSSANNEIGHGIDVDTGLGKGNLGDLHCTSRVYSKFIKNKDTSAGDMVVGDAATKEWTPLLSAGSKFTLPPDSIFVMATDNLSGLAVAESTSCNLRIAASGGDLDYALNWVGQSN